MILHFVALNQVQQETCLWENYETIWSYEEKDKENFGIFWYIYLCTKQPFFFMKMNKNTP